MSKTNCQHINREIIKSDRSCEETFRCPDCKTFNINIKPHEHEWKVMENKEMKSFIFLCEKCSWAKVILYDDLNKDE
jgi:phage FluMu protein Com